MRLELIDGIRGHLLIMMMLAHLSWQPEMGFLGVVHHAKIIGLFDAEFLVFMSGLLIGMLMVRKFKTRDNLNRFLLQRLVKIYKYYIVSAIPFLVLTALAATPALPAMLGEPLWATGEVLVIQNGGTYSDILPIYLYCFVLLLAGSATVMRYGTVGLLLASALIYAASLPNFSYGFFGLSGKFMAFDVAAWQFLFFIAFALGMQYQRIITLVISLPSPGFLALLALSAGLVLMQRGWVEYPVLFTLPQEVADNWYRMHLHPLHLIRILIVCAFFALLMIHKHPWTAFATSLIERYLSLRIVRYTGIFSIQMFVIHVYLMALYQYVDQDLTLAGKTTLALVLMALFLALPLFLHRWKQSRRAALLT